MVHQCYPDHRHNFCRPSAKIADFARTLSQLRTSPADAEGTSGAGADQCQSLAFVIGPRGLLRFDDAQSSNLCKVICHRMT